MENRLFRKKSIERISTPEELNDYIKVCSPPLWLVLVAIILLLSSSVVWGMVGKLHSTVKTVAIVKNDTITVYVKESDFEAVEGKKMTVHGTEYTISKDMCSSEPVPVNNSLSEYARHIGNLSIGEWVYLIAINSDIPDGVYEAGITIESISPISFIIN